MKTVFTSLILAGILCLVLTFTGVLHFDSPLGSWQDDGPAQADNSQDSKESSHTVRECSIHDWALQFLRESEYKDGTRVEEQFAEFLQQELDLDQTETERLVRMSFWKNFVTLQHEWQPDEIEKMEMSFKQEKELKQAGFAAKGLTLMENEIREAKARLQAIQQQLQAKVTKGDAT